MVAKTVQGDNLHVDPNTGNVGIGKTNPAAKLDVKGNIAADDIVLGGSDPYVRRNVNDKHVVISGGSGWVDTGAIALLHGSSDSVSSNPHGLEFYTGGSYERLRINKDGNVGIGTTNPTAKLDVAGDIAVNGNKISRICRCVGQGGLTGMSFWGPEGEPCIFPNYAWGTYNLDCRY